jgi:hypothetical protein
MSKNEARERALSAPSDTAGKASGSREKKHEKRTITEIREIEEDRRKDGLHVGTGLHIGQMGRDGRS